MTDKSKLQSINEGNPPKVSPSLGKAVFTKKSMNKTVTQNSQQKTNSSKKKTT